MNTNKTMKKTFILIPLLLLLVSTAAAQGNVTVAEPEFIGEVLVVDENGSAELLEKQTVLVQTRMGAGVYLAGIGKAKTKILLDGATAPTRLKSGDRFRFIIKAVDNKTDPMAIISIFSLKATKKNHSAEISSVSTFGSVKSNKLQYLPFTAAKYGESSYLITLREQPEGEYGITVRNPNHEDEKQMIVSSFAIE